MENGQGKEGVAYFHLPGLFEFYDFYSVFLPLFFGHREYFYDWCAIGSIYGAPGGCLWGGGRVGYGDADPESVKELTDRFGISARLTFSNLLLKEEHLTDGFCSWLCSLFEKTGEAADAERQNIDIQKPGPDEKNHSAGRQPQTGSGQSCGMRVQNGIIISSDLLLNHIQKRWPGFYFVSSTTKVLTDFNAFRAELDRPEFRFVVPDFRLNRRFDRLENLTPQEKDKTEFLVNECCRFSCPDRRRCYESVSRKALGEDDGFSCTSPDAAEGYVFSKAMKNPGFISLEDILDRYLPMGFSQFKIEGRGLGSAILLEFLLYYMTKPEYQLSVREAIYLDSELNVTEGRFFRTII